jgi:hypothetical protein
MGAVLCSARSQSLLAERFTSASEFSRPEIPSFIGEPLRLRMQTCLPNSRERPPNAKTYLSATRKEGKPHDQLGLLLSFTRHFGKERDY